MRYVLVKVVDGVTLYHTRRNLFSTDRADAQRFDYKAMMFGMRLGPPAGWKFEPEPTIN